MKNPLLKTYDQVATLKHNDHVEAINQQYDKSLAEYDENAKKRPDSIEPREQYIAGLNEWREKVMINARHAQAIEAHVGARGVWIQTLYSIFGGVRLPHHKGTFILKGANLHLKLDNPSATFGDRKTHKVTVAPGNMIHTEKTLGYEIL